VQPDVSLGHRPPVLSRRKEGCYSAGQWPDSRPTIESEPLQCFSSKVSDITFRTFASGTGDLLAHTGVGRSFARHAGSTRVAVNYNSNGSVDR